MSVHSAVNGTSIFGKQIGAMRKENQSSAYTSLPLAKDQFLPYEFSNLDLILEGKLELTRQTHLLPSAALVGLRVQKMPNAAEVSH